MPREAKLFESAKGLPSRALFTLRGNIPPNWIARARRSRKSLEPSIVLSMKKLRRLRKTRPNARMTIKLAERELKAALKDWETAFRKEFFYSGLRALLEISRDGASKR